MERARMLTAYARKIRYQSFGRTLRQLANPSKVARHVHRIATGKTQIENWYLPSYDVEAERKFVADVCGDEPSEVAAAWEELAKSPVVDEARRVYRAVRGTELPADLGRFKMLYAIVRLTKPKVVIETGVHDGLSSFVLLAALAANDAGRLVSIDLPAPDLPSTANGPGWLVPISLHGRWDLRLGDATRLLPQIAAEHADKISLFIHDSDHSISHQRFEYTAVRPHLALSAIVLSDQDFPEETVLTEIAAAWGWRHLRVPSAKGPDGEPRAYIGAVMP